MRYLSPLRYPGGKAKLAPFLARVVAGQERRPTQYAEPFAGGAGAALRLLVDGHVERIHLNDLDPGIAAFWRAATHHTDELVDRIRKADVTIDAWHQHAGRYRQGTGSDVELGFATFFLNRTNRSGILRGRPIGGLDQSGAWGIDARWNSDALVERIQLIGLLRQRIVVTEFDARHFLRTLPSAADTLVYVDPPYLVQGDRLYLDTFSQEDHRELAATLHAAEYRWVLTYDHDQRVTRDLYAKGRCAEFDINHTARVHHVGKELMVFSGGLSVPDMQVTRLNAATWVR